MDLGTASDFIFSIHLFPHTTGLGDAIPEGLKCRVSHISAFHHTLPTLNPIVWSRITISESPRMNNSVTQSYSIQCVWGNPLSATHVTSVSWLSPRQSVNATKLSSSLSNHRRSNFSIFFFLQWCFAGTSVSVSRIYGAGSLSGNSVDLYSNLGRDTNYRH
jgi:hypothetical protein